MTDVVIAPRIENPTSDTESVASGGYFSIGPSAAYVAGGQWVQPVQSAAIQLTGSPVTVKLDPLPSVPYKLIFVIPDGQGKRLEVTEYRIVPSSGVPVAWETLVQTDGPMGSPVLTNVVDARLTALETAVGGVSGGASNLASITDMSAFMRTVNDDTSAAAARTTLGAADDTLVAHLAGTETLTGTKTINTLNTGTLTVTTAATVPTPTTSGHAATKAYVDSQVTSGTIADATTILKGKVQLAGDLGGTAESPTVPALATINATLTSLAASITTLNTTVAALKAGWVINRAVAGVYPARPVTAAGQPVLWVGPTQPTTGGTVSSATGAVNGLDFYGILA